MQTNDLCYPELFEIKINCDDSFNVQEHWFHDFLYWTLHSELYFFTKELVDFHSIDWLLVTNMFSLFENIFFTKTCFFVHITHFSVNLYGLKISANKYLMTNFCWSQKDSV